MPKYEHEKYSIALFLLGFYNVGGFAYSLFAICHDGHLDYNPDHE